MYGPYRTPAHRQERKKERLGDKVKTSQAALYTYVLSARTRRRERTALPDESPRNKAIE